MKALHGQEAQGKVEIIYFDQSGVSLTPVIPYAWQPVGQTYELPATERQRLNLLGFFTRAQAAFHVPVSGTVNSQTVIEAIDAFLAQRGSQPRPALLVLDNSSLHHSDLFSAQHERWLAQGLGLHYLPPYSSELNLIERLWRKLKYEWLPWRAFTELEHLKAAVGAIFEGIGSQYQITFG